METNGDGRPLPKSGLYKQKETGVEQVLFMTPELGTAQIDAFIKAGFERVGDVPTEPTVVSDTSVKK
jgi:hypothetical protein